tara:strand:+ start:2958 stop:13250 length:10293 start_codon:yes stop_codon:yes gene_type:complete
MAQDKKVFTGGMDKDSDPRLIKQGDYRDALNIRSVSSSDSTAGSVENIEGNTLVPYNFITENNEYVNVESGIGVNGTGVSIDDVQPDLVNLSQTIVFSGTESINYFSNFTIGYESDESSDPVFISTSFTTWFGSAQLTNTSQTLYDKFGPGGPLSSFSVVDLITGLPININASVDFLPGDLFDGSNSFSITFTSSQPGASFNLIIKSTFSNTDYPQGEYDIGEDYSDLNNYYIGQNTIINGSTGFSQSDNDTNVDDDGTTFGPGPADGVGSTVYEFNVDGEQGTTTPGDPENNVNMYSYDQTAGDGLSTDDYIITEVLNLTESIDKFNSGGEFEFGPSQDSISQFLVDAISNDKFGEVIIEGSNGSTTELSSITTNFVKTTSLGGKSSNLGRNNPDAVPYSQLEFYFNSEEVSEGDGFSINQGTLTFSGEEVKAVNTYSLSANIIEGKNFKLDLTVSGLPSGNSFTVNVGNDTFGTISADGSHSIFINDPNNSSVIFLQFDKDFTSSDTLTLTNVRLFLENEQVDRLTVRLASPNFTRFKLAFASSETELRNDLVAGSPVTSLSSWYSGTGIELINKSAGTTDLSSVSDDYQELLLELQEAENTIRLLRAQINSITDTYNNQISILEQQLAVANSNLAQVEIELANAIHAEDTLRRENETLRQSQRQLQNVIATFIDQAIDPKPEILVNLYAGNIDTIKESLNLIAADLVNLTTTTIVNSELQDKVNDLTADNANLQAQLEELSNIIITENDTDISLIQAATELKNKNTQLDEELSTLQNNINIVLFGDADDLNNAGGLYSELGFPVSQSEFTLTSLATLISSTLSAQQSSYESQIDILNVDLSNAQSLATSAELSAAFAEGAASVDITSDNAILAAAAFADGVASVPVITQENFDTAIELANADVLFAQEAVVNTQQALDDAQAALDAGIEDFGDTNVGPMPGLRLAVDNAIANLAAAELQVNINQAFFNGVQSITADDGISQSDVEAAYLEGVASVIPDDGITQDDVDAAVANAAEAVAAAEAAAAAAEEAKVLAQGELANTQILLFQADQLNASLQSMIDDFNNQVTITSVELVSDPTLNTDIGFTQPQGTFFSQSDGSIKFSQTAANGSVYDGSFKSAHFPINNDINIPSSQVQNLRLIINVPFCVHPFTVRVGRSSTMPYFYFPTISEPGVYVLEPPSDLSPEEIVSVIVLIQTEGALSDEALNTEGPLFVIESMSIAYAESVSGLSQEFLQDLQNNLSSLQEEVEVVDEAAESAITDLSSGLEVISGQIQEYANLLNQFNASSALLQAQLEASIDELGLTSTIDQFYIDNVTSSFQNNEANLNDDIDALTNFTGYIQNVIDSSGVDSTFNSDNVGFLFNISINRATAVTRQYVNSLPNGISHTNNSTGVYVLALRNTSLHGSSSSFSNPDLYYNIGTIINRDHFRPDNRKNLQGTASFWDSNVNQDGAPFQNVVKNVIKDSYLYNNGVDGNVIQMYSGDGSNYDSNTSWLLNPGVYYYQVTIGSESIPMVVDFNAGSGVDYTNYAVSISDTTDDVSWEASADNTYEFSIQVVDPRPGWEIVLIQYTNNGSYRSYDNLNDTSVNMIEYRIVGNKAFADFTTSGSNSNHVDDGTTIDISCVVTDLNAINIPQPHQSGTVERFVRAVSSDSYGGYSLDAPSTIPSSDSDIIVNKSIDESPTITKGVRRYVYNSILNKNRSISLASEDFVCIGSYEDKPLSRIYYFVHDTSVNNFDCILEYDLALDSIKTVYQDGRLGSNGQVETVLNFSRSNLITGVNKVDDILYFTDNLNRPRKINVELGKKNEENIKNAVRIEDVFFPGGFDKSAFLCFDDEKIRSFKIGDNVFSHIGNENQVEEEQTQIQFNGWSEVIGIVRRISSSFTFNVTSGSNEITVSPTILSDNTLAEGEFIGIMDNGNFPRFFKVIDRSGATITVETPPNFTSPTEGSKPFNILVNDIETSIGAILTNCPFESGAVASGILMHADPDDAYSPLISFGDRDNKVKYLDAVKHQPELRPQTELKKDPSNLKNNILDNLFQFKYRYIHYDNENTSYSGISDINPDTSFSRNVPVKFNEYQEIKNIIEVEYFDTISDVKKIEIVARTGNDGEFVLVDTVQNNFTSYLKEIKNSVISDPAFHFDVPKSIIKFKNNGVYPFIDRADSNKLFDSVPKLAKAQTILSNNRIAYGNVVEGFDNTPMVVESKFSPVENSIITTDTTNLTVFAKSDGSFPIENGFTQTGETGAGFISNASAANTNLATVITNDLPNEDSAWGSNDNNKCKVSLFLDLSPIDLNDTDSQIISIDIGWMLKRTNGDIKQRSGRLAMDVDLTGATTINQARQAIIDQFNNEAYEGGGSVITGAQIADANESGLSENGLTVQVSGTDMLKIKWKLLPNSQGSGSSNSPYDPVLGGWIKVVTNINVVYTSGSSAINSFKTGSFHDFGIAYFDETNRCSFVNVAPDFGSEIILEQGFGTESISPNLNGTRCYNSFVTESEAPISGQLSAPTFSIYNKPPKWATHYQMLYAGNTSVGEFIQVTIAKTVAGDGNDTQMYLGLESLKDENKGYINSSGALVDFDVAKGDRIRFISCVEGGERKLFTEYLDFEITGFDLHDELNPISTSENGDGFYLRIANPASDGDNVSIEGNSSVSISHTGFSLSTSGYNKLIAEIYRPRLSQEEENLVYYEIGDKIEIGNPGEPSRYHSGQVNQVPEYFYSKDVNTEVSLIPAEVTLDGGDVYLKSRTMYTETNGDSIEAFACEDYFLNDFHKTNHYDKGRINVVNNNSEERRLKASIFFSEPYVSTGAINGLSNFNLANTPYFDYNKDFGSIQYLSNQNNDLIIFHESKVGRVLVGKDILNTASGEGLVSLSNKIIDNYAIVYSGQYGCSLNPESVIKQGNVFYFTDIQRGSVLRLSNDGITVISDNGMKDYFRDLGEMFLKYNPEYNDDLEFTPSIVGGYDPKYNEYIVTFPSIISNPDSGYAAETYVWSDSIATWNEITTKPENAFDDKVVIFNPVTVAFSEESNRWTSFYSYIPEYYSKVNRQFVTFKQGRLYRHNDSDKYSRSNQAFNKFYGNNNLSYIDFVFNAEPSSIKTYNAISLESDTKFITGLFSNMGQHYGNYDEVITTNIAFKKVKGKCSNNLTVSNFEIQGIDTKFYEDVSPGDLIKVIGNASEEQHIVSKVISNTLIEVEEEMDISLDNNTMLVIDYKTKEGIQYADIPFCTSDIESRGENFNFGDGSDIQGVGIVSGLDDDNENLSIVTSLTTTANLNKPISPSDMINGASYVITYIAPGEEDLISASDSSYGSNQASVGDVITHNGSSSATESLVVSANLSIYIKKTDSTTEFLGYPYSIISGTFNGESATKILIAGNYSYDSSYDGGFLFMTKTGSIEGERMKGSYMRAILATNSNQSKKKFNLYAVNADVDKSELSNR